MNHFKFIILLIELNNNLPDSFNVLINAVIKIFNNFLFKMAGVHFVKHRVKNEIDSAFTDGFLLSIAPKISS